MAELLKNIYNADFLRQFGNKIQSAYKPFDIAAFIGTAAGEEWDGLALKARVRKITKTLGVLLPSRYDEALGILFDITDECVGFPYVIFPDFVAIYGQNESDWERSLNALERFTQKSSAEFAIRPFLLKEPERVMKRMETWTKHPNEHVRRLASEGCRPRLPWGEALPMFKKDPAPVITVLESLKADPSLYVRKSVANNLNDISHDNPDVTLETSERWKGIGPGTDWIIRHGCRTLVKKADPRAMALFSYESAAYKAPLVTHVEFSVSPLELAIGEHCELQYTFDIRDGEPLRLRVEYGIDFVKAKGHFSRKTFFMSDKTANGGDHVFGRRVHNFTNMTTRRHYPGNHRIVLLVNGQEVASKLLRIAPQ
jgi:3-methyladenine DNA glycosylase AlkC